MFIIWKTIKETPWHLYQQKRWSNKRRAVGTTDLAIKPYHGEWVKGGDFRKPRGPAVKAEVAA
jgi:hypothetical protein